MAASLPPAEFTPLLLTPCTTRGDAALMNAINEPQLVQAVGQADRRALASLLEAHQKRLYNLVLRMVGHREDAAEVTQEVMLKIVQHAQDFKGQCAIWTWMARIAMNESISHLRRRQVRRSTSLDMPGRQLRQAQGHDQTPLREQIADSREPGPAARVQQKEMLENLSLAMSQLDEAFRQVLVLRDIGGCDYEQIALILGIPVGTVKSRLFRARLALRQLMFRLVPPPKTAGDRD